MKKCRPWRLHLDISIGLPWLDKAFVSKELSVNELEEPTLTELPSGHNTKPAKDTRSLMVVGSSLGQEKMQF